LAPRYQDLKDYRKTVLDNGVRIVTEKIPYFQSVSLGIWVRSGSRFEQPPLNGICHFIEHMLFKGTDRRSAYTIACEIDSVGGALNAFTSKEFTSFYCRVLHENLEMAVDLLADIFLNASFPEEEIEREKLVVCQEIHQMEDSPEDLVHELLGIRFWRDNPLGQPILGTVPNIVNLNRETLVGFKTECYSPDQTVISAAGNLDHDRFVDMVAEQMNRLTKGTPLRTPVAPSATSAGHLEIKDLEQTHVCVGAEGPGAISEKRHAAYLLHSILGGGMSSRLFQEIREKRGLAYSVYSFMSSFSDTGLFGIYAACDPDRVKELLAVTSEETMKLCAGITDEEIRTAKNQLRGGILLSMESSEARMNRLAKSEYYFSRYVPFPEVIEALQAVTRSDLEDVCREMIEQNSFTVVVLGPVEENFDLSGYFGID